MGIEQILVPLLGGAAKGFVARQDDLRKEYRVKKDRQKAWADANGRKIMADLEAKSDFVLNAGESLENAGLATENVKYIVDTYGTNALIKLKEQVDKLGISELEALKVASTDGKGGLNTVIKMSNEYEPDDTTWAETVVKDFQVNQISDKDAPDRPKGFLANLRYQMSGGSFEDEHDEWMNEDFITDSRGQGVSIRELRAAPLGRPSRGTVANFDLTALDESEGISRKDQQQWRLATTSILDYARNALSNDPTLMDALTSDIDGQRVSAADQLSNLKNKPELKEVFDDALNDVNKAIPLSGNTAAELYLRNYDGAFGGILNPISPEEQEQALLADLEENNLKREDIAEVATEAEGIKHFKDHNVDYVIVDGELRKRDVDNLFDPKKAVPVEDKSLVKAREDQAERLLEIEKLPDVEPFPEGSDARAYMNQREWNINNKGRYNKEGKVIAAPKYPTNETEMKLLFGPPWNLPKTRRGTGMNSTKVERTLEELQNYWIKTYGETHDKLTGFPTIVDQEPE